MKCSVLLQAACVFASSVVPLIGQQQADQKPLAFEVASIKPNKSGSTGISIGGSGGRWTMTNVTIAGLILTAYRTPTMLAELPGAPSWVMSERYDIDARATFAPTKEQERIMLRELLAERFKFRAHYETQERPIYNLVVARADGRLGPQIRPIDIDCASYKPDADTALAHGTADAVGVRFDAGERWQNWAETATTSRRGIVHHRITPVVTADSLRQCRAGSCQYARPRTNRGERRDDDENRQLLEESVYGRGPTGGGPDGSHRSV
jgi:uncharacterized protein (TIGR03435 family)